MSSSTPHYLLFSEGSYTPGNQSWRFVLQNVTTSRRLSVTDVEPTAYGERLELLAVVRGLEALEGSSRVTLVTKSRYVSRGIRFGISDWRSNDWQWERFGRLVPVKDHDLWQRIDRALLFHEVECQAWQFEDAAADEPRACHDSHATTADVEATGLIGTASRCSETRPNSCEISPDSESVGRLAPTKRRSAVRRRSRKAVITPTLPATVLGSLAVAVVNKATTWSEALRGLGSPVRHLVQGAA